jgi:hypothetical protein
MLVKRIRGLCVLLAVCLLSAGCPLTPTPPHSVQGLYTGRWEAMIPLLGSAPVGCEIRLNLKHQALTSFFPVNHMVTGEVVFEFTCLEVGVLAQLLGVPDTVSYDVVTGSIDEMGKLTLTCVDNVSGFTSGALLRAETVDGNADGRAETMSGSWYFTLPTGAIPILVEGEFTAGAG